MPHYNPRRDYYPAGQTLSDWGLTSAASHVTVPSKGGMMRNRDDCGIERPEPRELRRVIMYGVLAVVLLILATAGGRLLAQFTDPIIEHVR